MLARLFSFLFGDDMEGRSPQWPAVRAEHLAIHGVCEACGTSHDLQVHHIQSVSMRPDLELDHKNLITLCGDQSHACHLRIGHSFDWQAVNPYSVQDAALQGKRIRERKRR